MSPIDALVEHLEAAWAQTGYRSDAFGELAARAFGEVKPYLGIEPVVLLKTLLEELPVNGVGAVTGGIQLRARRRWALSMRSALDEKSQLKTPGALGAIYALSGPTVWCTGQFEAASTSSTEFAVGSLHSIEPRVLQPGEAAPLAAPAHFQWMLPASPSGLVLVAHTTERLGLPDLEVLPSSVRLRSSVPEPVVRQRRALEALWGVDRAAWRAALTRALASTGPVECLALSRYLGEKLSDAGDEARALWSVAQPAFGEYAPRIVESLAAEVRRRADLRHWRTLEGGAARVARAKTILAFAPSAS